jgi:hypothetical protein
MHTATVMLPARPLASLHLRDFFNDWQVLAACRGIDPALFHGSIHDMRQAQHVCAGYPVAEICLWTAMAYEDPVHRCGVWGGLLPVQRHRLAAVCLPDRAGERLVLELAWWAA